MIYHFFEVWLLLLAAFLVGCTLGALLYETVAGSGLAGAQYAVGGVVRAVVDGVKGSLGMGPAWRPASRRVAEAAVVATEPMSAAPPEPEERELVASEVEPLALVVAEPAVPALAPPPVEAAPAVGTDEAPAVADDDGAGAPVPDDVALVARQAVDAVRARRQKFRREAARRSVALPPPDSAPAEPPEPQLETRRPAGLAAPRNGVPDNLQRIRGIGEKNELRLNKLGIFHFGQIAAWTPAEVRWIAQQLAFPERIERDDWVGQAIVLASGGDTGFTKAVDRRRARRRALRDGEAVADDEMP